MFDFVSASERWAFDWKAFFFDLYLFECKITKKYYIKVNLLFLNCLFPSVLWSIVFLINIILVQDKYPWITNLTVVTSVTKEARFVENICFQFNKVTLLNPSWEFKGISLILNKVNMSTTSLLLSSLDKQHPVRIVNMTNSTFGNLNVSNGYQITLSQCYIDGTTSTLLVISNCTLTITRCNFYKNAGPGFGIAALRTTQATMEDVNFIQIVYVQGNLFNITSNSSLYLNRVTFHRQGDAVLSRYPYLYVELDSTATLEVCTFADKNEKNKIRKRCELVTNFA